MKQSYVIFGMIILLLLAGAIFAWQKKGTTTPTTVPPTPTTIPTTVQPTTTPTVTPILTKPAGWKTYRNEELGFEVSYPASWHVYDKAAWERDNAKEPCIAGVGFVHLMNGILFSAKDLGTCVDYYPDPRPGGLAFHVSEEVPIDYNIKEPGVTITTIDGEKAQKVPTLRNTTIPQRENFTTIEFNHKGRGYTVYFGQTDRNGHYDPVLDQILSTFHFLD